MIKAKLLKNMKCFCGNTTETSWMLYNTPCELILLYFYEGLFSPYRQTIYQWGNLLYFFL